MSKLLNVGVVGTSVISTAFIKAAQESQSFNIKALYSRDSLKGMNFCQTYHIESLYTEYETLLKDESLQVIYIASPNNLHYPQARSALLAGKDVISEKPMVSTLQEALELQKISRKTNCFVVEAITSRALPNLDVVRKHLSEIGTLHLIQVSMAQYSARYTQLKEGILTNVFDPAHSGGALYDIGIYTVSLVLSLFGKPSKTNYTANLFTNGIDTSGILLMEYPTFKAVCSFAKDSFGLNQAVFSGDKGYLQIIGAASSIPQVLMTLDNQTRDLSIVQNANPLYQETIVFSDLFKTRNMIQYQSLFDHSICLAEILENSRKQVGIVFSKTDE
jgi:predicted dehydrogenase